MSIGVRRAKALADLLAPTGAWVFEDDHAGDISTSPLVSLGRHLPARTVLVQSFSKSFGPDLRLAAVGGPDDLLGELVARRLLGAGLVEPPAAGGAARAAGRPRHRRDPGRGPRDATRGAAATSPTRCTPAASARPARTGSTCGSRWPTSRPRAYRLATSGVGVAVGSPFVPTRAARDHIRITSGLVRDEVGPLADLVAEAAAPADPAHPGLVSVVERPYLGCIRMAPSSRMTSPFR